MIVALAFILGILVGATVAAIVWGKIIGEAVSHTLKEIGAVPKKP